MEDVLLHAVRRGDTRAVAALLADGADPDTVGDDGLPVLCAAVDACDDAVAAVLIEGGADRDRRLSDGSTPLLRAVDSGSPQLVHAAWWDAGGKPTTTGADELLARARQGREDGIAGVLRRRTGAAGPLRRRRVDNEWFASCEEAGLAGVTVRDGHAAVLTRIESHVGIRAPFAVLLARALTRPDPDHVVWFEVLLRLGDRQDEETWRAAVELGTHPDPVRRRFAVDVLFTTAVGAPPHGTEVSVYEGRVLEVLLSWAARETDPLVLQGILCGLAQHIDPRVEAVGLRHVGHPDPRIRAAAAATLQGWGELFSEAARGALAALLQDPDPAIRAVVCNRLAECTSTSPGIPDLLAGRLDDEDGTVRLWAVYGLAERDDPRCLTAARPPAEVPGPEWSWIREAAERYEKRRGSRTT